MVRVPRRVNRWHHKRFDLHGHESVCAQWKTFLILWAQPENTELIRAEINRDHLVRARMSDFGSLQRPFQNPNDVIGADQTDQDAYAQGGNTLDKDPAEVLKMLEKRFYRAALFFLQWIEAFRFGVIHHGWKAAKRNQALVLGEVCETV